MNAVNTNNSFFVFPNPTNDRVTISSTEPLAATTIYNLNGQLVLQTNGLGNSGIANMEIDVSSLPSGLYVIHAQTTSGQLLQAKFIKQ